MKRKTMVTLLALTTVAAMATVVSAAEEGKTYGVSVMTHNNSFFLAEIEGIEGAIGENDEVVAPDPALDISTQVEQISDMISSGVDVIMIDAIDSEGIKPALVEAKEAGTPVIAIDTEVADPEYVESTIVSDNVDAGRLAGKCLVDAIGGKGKVAIIDHSSPFMGRRQKNRPLVPWAILRWKCSQYVHLIFTKSTNIFLFSKKL